MSFSGRDVNMTTNTPTYHELLDRVREQQAVIDSERETNIAIHQRLAAAWDRINAQTGEIHRLKEVARQARPYMSGVYGAGRNDWDEVAFPCTGDARCEASVHTPGCESTGPRCWKCGTALPANHTEPWEPICDRCFAIVMAEKAEDEG